MLGKDELFQRLFDPSLPVEGDLEALFRGDVAYSLEVRAPTLCIDNPVSLFWRGAIIAHKVGGGLLYKEPGSGYTRLC